MTRPLLIVAFGVLVAHTPASAQTVATKRAREAVAIINAATPKLLKAYVDSAFGGPMRDRSPDGISSNLDIFKGTGYVAVVLANYGDAGQPVVDKIRSLVRARTAPNAQ